MPRPIENENELNNSKFNFTSASRNERIASLIQDLFNVLTSQEASSQLEMLFNFAISSESFCELDKNDRAYFFFTYNRIKELFQELEALEATKEPQFNLN